MSEKLKACPSPWCKESAPELQQGGYRNGHFRVECQTCFTKGPTRDDLNGGGPAAIAAWNTRTTEDAVERVARAIEPLLRYHETGGHEGDGSDERLAIIRAALEGDTPAQDIGE